MTQREQLTALAIRLSEELSPEETQVLREAAQLAARLEQGDGFSLAPVVSQRDYAPLIDASWMGMLAQLKPSQAREMALWLLEAASEAETDAAIVAFFRRDLQFDDSKAALALALMRKARGAARQPIQASRQEAPASQGKPS